MATSGQPDSELAVPDKRPTKTKKRRTKVSLTPSSKVKGRYSAGVLPLSYTLDDTGIPHWWILMSMETREEGECIHPLAGKKEDSDEDSPIKTAAREFHEETMDLYSTIPVEELLNLSVTSGHYIYIPSSKMYFIPVLLPYSPYIYVLSDVLRQTGRKGSRLFWTPLRDFLKVKQNVVLTIGDEVIRPSAVCKEWYSSSCFISLISSYKNYLLQLLNIKASA